MGRSWRASSDLTAQKIRLFYSQKMLTKYEAFFTEIYENDRFSQGVGWKCKVFFANPVLGGRTKSAVRAHNHSYDWIIYCKRRFCAGSRFRRWNRTFREPIRPIQNIKYEIHNFLDFSFFRFFFEIFWKIFSKKKLFVADSWWYPMSRRCRRNRTGCTK